MDWVYPAHVTCPVARHVRGKHKKCEAGYIMRFTELGSNDGIVCKEMSDPDVRGGGGKIVDANLFAGVVLDRVDGSDEKDPLTTVQFRGVTNVRLSDEAVEELTKIAQTGDNTNVYGVRLYMARDRDEHPFHYVATTDVQDEQAVDLAKHVIGFVHTYHCNSRYAEMEIIPRYPSQAPTDGATAPVREGYQGAMVDAGDGDAPEFVHHRKEDQVVLNAASGFAMALGQKTKNPKIAVTVGSFVATANSHEHKPVESLGAKVGDGGNIELRPGSAAHALIKGTRDRKRKAASKIDNLEHTVVVRNGQLDYEDPDFNPAGTFPSKHFNGEAVEQYQKRLALDLGNGTVSSPAEYAADLGFSSEEPK